jgi:hypothetical protein
MIRNDGGVMRQAGWVVALAMIGYTGPAWAGRMAVHDAAESTEYKVKAGGMLGRGVLNALTCFVDPIVAVVDETRNGPPLVGTLVGVGKGLGCGTLRLLSGGVDIVTFWVPGFNGIPIGTEYGDCFTGASSGAAAPAASPAMEQPWTSTPSMSLPVEPATPPPPAPESKPYTK